MQPRPLIFMIACSLAASLANAHDGESNLAALEGRWGVVSIIDDGESVPMKDVDGFTFVFKKQSLTWYAPDGTKVDQFKVAIDSTRRPIPIDLVQMSKEGELKKTLGIYELTENSLRICLPPRGSTERPDTLESESGSFLSLMTLKRIKASPEDSGRTKR